MLIGARHLIFCPVQAGNRGPATRLGWGVDLTGPTAALRDGTSSRPPQLTNIPEATFRFTADESRVMYQCRVLCAARNPRLYLTEMLPTQVGALTFSTCSGQAAEFDYCTSPATYTGLVDGIHRFEVRAIDAAGNVQSDVDLNGQYGVSSTKYLWEVDRVAPVVNFVRAPNFTVSPGVSVVRDPVVEFAFQGEYSGVTYKCKTCTVLDGGSGAQSSADCSLYETCSDEVSVRNMRESASTSRLDPSPLAICPAAIAVGCTYDDVHTGPASCPLGFMRICEMQQYSFVNRGTSASSQSCDDPRLAINAAAMAQRLRCVRRSMYRHTLLVRGTDLAGNTGPEAAYAWYFDIIPPTVAFTTSIEPSAMSASLTNPYLPRRPFVSIQGGVVEQLNLYTQETSITISFDADATEQYLGNGPTTFMCRVAAGDQTVLDSSPCASPLVLDGTNGSGAPFLAAGLTRLGAGGVQVMVDGTYRLFVLPTDHAGNVGEVYSFTWTVDTQAPSARFPAELNLKWTSSADVGLRFLCTEPGCSFTCQLETLAAPSLADGSALLSRSTLDPLRICGTSPIQLVLSLEVNDTGVGTGAAIVLEFLEASRSELIAELEAMLGGFYDIVSLRLTLVGANTVPAIEARFGIELKPQADAAAATISATFEAFRPGSIELPRGYIGQSRSQICDRATGERCTCQTGDITSTATCTGTFGEPYECPCLAGFTGRAAFTIRTFAIDELSPESYALPNRSAAELAHYTAYAHTVLPSDAVGTAADQAASFTFYHDVFPPDTGVSFSADTHGVDQNLTVVFAANDQYLPEEQWRQSGVGHAGFRCRLTTVCTTEYTAGPCANASASGQLTLEPWHACGAGGTAGVGAAEFAGTSNGIYSLKVASVDFAGNFDSSPAVAHFVRDDVALETALYGAILEAGTATFMFGASQMSASCECRLAGDGVPAGLDSFHACSSPYTVAFDADATVSLEVRATDRYGRRDATPACIAGRLWSSSDDGDPVAAAAAICTEFAIRAPDASLGTGGGLTEACDEDLNLAAIIAIGIAWAVLVIGGLAGWWLIKRSELVSNPLGRKRETTRAFHNPVFNHDRPTQAPRPQPSIGSPSNFQHVATGASGLISPPSNFQHVSTGTSGLISGPSDFRHVAHGGPDGLVTTRNVPKRVDIKKHTTPGYFGVNKPEDNFRAADAEPRSVADNRWRSVASPTAKNTGQG